MNERNENVAARILRELHDIRVELRGSRGIRGEMQSRFDGLDVRIEGVAFLMTLMAGHARRLEDRMTRIEEDGLGRIDGDR